MAPRHEAVRRHAPLAMAGAVALAVTAATGIAIANAPKAHAASCLASGTDATINAALVGAGAQAVLCPGAVFSLANAVTFTAPNQEIYTQGTPTDSTRAILRIAGSSLDTAINGNGQAGVTVQNIQVDGNRPGLGYLNGGALLEMGGAGTGQTVQDIYAHDPRGWSALHFIEGAVTNSTPQCQNGKVLDNQIGPSGIPPTTGINGQWADGISMACGTSLVQGNTVTDATDGGIVVFGAPGSTIQNNTIIAASRQLFGGINMVDYAPMNGNYTGTKVTGNTINAQGAFIKVGIAMGQQVWNCTTGTNHGGTVTGNTLTGSYMGYGYAANGVDDWTVTGNVDNSTHVGSQTAGGCFGSPAASAPGGFQDQSANVTNSTLQSQFVNAELTNVLSVNGPTINAPTLSANPANLGFGNVDVGSSSGAQQVTITNNGTSSVTVNGVSATGDFKQTNTCGSSIAAGASCSANVTFTPTAAGSRTGTFTVTSSASNSPVSVPLSGTGATSTTNLALGATMTASGSNGGFPPSNANDGNTSSYWESTNNAFPQWLQADLGSNQSLGSVTLTLPPSSAWGTRTETFSVLDSTDGGNFTTIVPSAGYTFDPSTGNTVTFSLPSGTSARYLRLNLTANTGWPAGQVSEFEIFAGSGGTTNQNLALNRPASASGSTQNYVPANAVDGNTSSYWESTDNAFPQWCQVDLGSNTAIGSLVMDLPPSWGARTQTLVIQGSTDGSDFTTIVPSAGYTFDPATGNTVTVKLPSGTSARYVRLTFTANTGWPAGQLSELQMFS